MTRVMVVEDEEMIRKGIVLTVDWESLGCQVVAQAANGLEGLALAKTAFPDLIITDLKMPQMGGIEMLRRLREAGNKAAVIILTAFDDFAYAQSALRLGAVDYLLKPFHDGELEQAVARVCPAVPPQPDPLAEMRSGVKSKYILEAMDYVAAHYADPTISVGAVAKELGISEGHLAHMFKKEAGDTLLGYLTQYRIRQAMERLSDCRVKIYEVAEQVGYRDIAYFSNTFKKIVGKSPSEFQSSR